KATLELRQSVGRAARAKECLHGADPQPGVTGDRLGAGKALRKGRHLRRILQRILRADEKPDFVQIQPLQRFQRDMRMALVRWIEGPPKKADLRPACWQVAPQ